MGWTNWMTMTLVLAAVAGCTEGVIVGGGGGSRYDREVKGGNLHHAAVEGASRTDLDLGRVLASAPALAPAVGPLAAGDFTITTTTSRGATGRPLIHAMAQQHVGGVPIVDSHLYLTVAPGPGQGEGQLVASSYRLFHGADVDVTPSVDRARAEARARAVLRAPADAAVREARLVIRERSGALALAWDVTLDGHDGRALIHASGPRAGTADVLDDRVYETSGTVSAWVAVGGAPGAGGEPRLVAQADTMVLAGGASTSTAGDGRYLLAAPAGSIVTTTVAGLAALVTDVGGLSVEASAPAAPEVDLTLGGASERELAMTTAYHFTTAARRFLLANGVPASVLGAPLATRVNLASTCNAYYSPAGRTINFFRAGGGCNNSAEASIIAHEYGHFVDDTFGGITDGGLSEGWGDLLACFLLRDPVIGGDLFHSSGQLRTCDNDYRYPRSGHDSVHELGQAWSGFAWHARAGLMAAHGAEAGEARARALIMPSLVTNAPDIPAAVREVFLRDDDDGDLRNGTPNWDVLLAAAERHGLRFAVDVDHGPPGAVTDLIATAVTPTTVTLRWTAPGDDGDHGTAARYELRWALEPIDEASFAAAAHLPAPAPQPAGHLQTTIVSVPPVERLYLALRAIDELDHAGALSNVIEVELPAPRVIWSDGAEAGLGPWQATGLWHVSERRAAAGQRAFRYGDDATGTYDTPGRANQGALLSPVIDLDAAVAPRLTWREHVDVEESTTYDLLRVEVFDVDDPSIAVSAEKLHGRTAGFTPRLVDLSGLVGRRVRIRLWFDTVDAAINDGEGWYVDELRVLGDQGPAPEPPAGGRLLINELLADPPAGHDASGDGIASPTADEFVELVNIGDRPLDLGGATITDDVAVRGTFPPGTALAPGEVLVLFGGGVPALPGVRTMVLGPLALNNGGDTVTIRGAGGEVLAQLAYGSAAGDDQSLTRAVDHDPEAPLVKHRTLSSAPASPGRRATDPVP